MNAEVHVIKGFVTHYQIVHTHLSLALPPSRQGGRRGGNPYTQVLHTHAHTRTHTHPLGFGTTNRGGGTLCTGTAGVRHPLGGGYPHPLIPWGSAPPIGGGTLCTGTAGVRHPLGGGGGTLGTGTGLGFADAPYI